MMKEGVKLDGFTIRGGLIESGIASATARRAIAYLEKLPFKELIAAPKLAAELGVSLNYFRHIAPEVSLEPYRFNLRANRVFWGSKRTIVELKRINSER